MKHTQGTGTRPGLRVEPSLTFGELEPLACALLAVLLPFVRARVARQEAKLLQSRPQFCVELHQRPGNSQTSCPGLTGDAAAVGEDQQIELISGLGGRKRLPHHGPRALCREVILECAVVDLNFALAGPQKHAGYRSLPAARTQIL